MWITLFSREDDVQKKKKGMSCETCVSSGPDKVTLVASGFVCVTACQSHSSVGVTELMKQTVWQERLIATTCHGLFSNLAVRGVDSWDLDK